MYSVDNFSSLLGTRIKLLYTSDCHTLVQPGVEGTVVYIDGLNTIHVDWDNGSNLGLIPGVDRWQIIKLNA